MTGKKKAKRKITHSGARQPSVKKEKEAPTSHAVIGKQVAYNKRQPVKGKGQRKGKNNDDDDNDDDNDNDQSKKKRKQSDQDNIDDYLKYYSHLKPSSTLLKKAELDARTAQLLFAETSGYEYLDSAKITEELRSDDNEKREEAINKYLELIETLGPTLSEQTSIRNNYYAQGGHHQLLSQSCGCCGKRDFKNILNGELCKINASFTNNVLRLTSDELKNYTHSRVEGYLNATVMFDYATDKNISLNDAFKELYEDGTDENFKSLSIQAFNKLSSKRQFSTPDPLHQSEEPIVLFIVPDLVRFSSNPVASILDIGTSTS